MKQGLCVLGIAVAVGLIALVPSAQSGTPTCFGKPATKVGTDGNDGIDGTNGDDVIVTLGGADSVHGQEGNDLICTGTGSDSVEGNAGNDRIDLGPSDCGSVQAAQGDDSTMFANGGGNDVLYDTANCTTIPINNGLIGDSGDDQLFGKGGPDDLIGGPGSDKLYGAAGNDLLEGDDGEPDLLSGGKGKDICKSDPSGDTVKGCP